MTESSRGAIALLPRASHFHLQSRHDLAALMLHLVLQVPSYLFRELLAHGVFDNAVTLDAVVAEV